MLKRQVYKLDKFFSGLSAQSNYIPEDVVKEVYYGLIRLIGSTIKEKGKIDCPDLGTFVLHTHKARNAFNVKTGVTEFLGERKIVKFKTCRKMKEFFYDKKKLV
jgi:nucleoid DNA-binding protein